MQSPFPFIRRIVFSLGTIVGFLFSSSFTEFLQAQTDTKGDWPEFRGPTAEGHSTQTGLPLKWSETQRGSENILWKTPIPGRGWSSPVVSGNQIWLTTCDGENGTLRVLCVDRETGKIEKNIQVYRKRRLGRIHAKNSHASPTPVIEDDKVYVHFGGHITLCLNRSGEILWKTQLRYYHHHGPAGSPIVVDDLLIVNCDGYDRSGYERRKRIDGVRYKQSVVALDKNTGKKRWQKSRVKGRHAYCTCLLIEVDGKKQVVSPGGDQVVAYDPETGDEIWRCSYVGYSVVPKPVYAHGLVFLSTGYDNPEMLAIKPDGKGDVTDSHISWRAKRIAPRNASPLVIGEELYLVTDDGVLSCVNAKTGKIHWRKRLTGSYTASPVFVDGRIYLTSEAGTTHVFEPGMKYSPLSVNRISDRVLASMAVTGKSFILRSEKFLYRIETSEEQ